jgi:hypothetical protein
VIDDKTKTLIQRTPRRRSPIQCQKRSILLRRELQESIIPGDAINSPLNPVIYYE